jgi:CII-binding regulator of phage lambda lysogenization HflD
MTKKLNLDTKIRDAAMSLSKVNASYKHMSKQTDEHLESANRRVEIAQRELWRISERSSEVHKKLLEHRAGVLGFSVRNLEEKMSSPPSTNGADESGYSTPNRSSQMSPTSSSVTSASTSSKARFDGAHLFAGHADAVVPKMPKGSLSIGALEEKLRTATQAMNAATQRQAEMARELSHLRLEKEQVETTMGMELQNAEENIRSLEKGRSEGADKQLEESKREKKAWERERETLESRLEVLEGKSGELTQVKQLLAEAKEKSRAEIWEAREQWEADKAQWEKDKAELENGVRALRTLAATHAIPIMSGNSSLDTIIDSVGMHLAEVASQLQTPGGGLRDLSDASKVAAVLQPIWTMLPSPELRASKLTGGRPAPSRSGSQGQNSPSGLPPPSLSDMDVRTLKTLYDPRANMPNSPNTATFSVEAFAGRVQALIADDRGLIERLLRFAQAHDLLKKNAERAQKLATESNSALETYQKQVRTLEERNTSMTAKQTAMYVVYGLSGGSSDIFFSTGSTRFMLCKKLSIVSRPKSVRSRSNLLHRKRTADSSRKPTIHLARAHSLSQMKLRPLLRKYVKS